MISQGPVVLGEEKEKRDRLRWRRPGVSNENPVRYRPMGPGWPVVGGGGGGIAWYEEVKEGGSEGPVVMGRRGLVKIGERRERAVRTY